MSFCPIGTKVKSEAPKGAVIVLVFLLFISALPNAINALILLFAAKVKKLFPRSQSGSLQNSLYNAWKWPVILDIPINPTKCKYIAIRREFPFQLSCDTATPGDSIQIANVDKNLKVHTDRFVPPSVQKG